MHIPIYSNLVTELSQAILLDHQDAVFSDFAEAFRYALMGNDMAVEATCPCNEIDKSVDVGKANAAGLDRFAGIEKGAKAKVV
jgi:hypothetical protein